jgi:hypothetical protein
MAGAGRAKARTVTGMVVGSSAWFGGLFFIISGLSEMAIHQSKKG